MRALRRLSNALFGLVLPAAHASAATTGLYALSYGAGSAGMAGATLASGSDALSQIENPASLTRAGARVDLNLAYLRSQLQFQNHLNDPENERGFSNYPFSDNNFFLPALGMAYPIRGSDASVGLQFYGLGGDATRFYLKDFSPPAGFGADQQFRSNLVLLSFGPAVAYRLTRWVSLGAALQVTAGRLQIDHPFGTFALPHSVRFRLDYHMSNYDFEFGFGGRVGATFEPAPWVKIALAYQTPRDLDMTGRAQFTFPAGTGLKGAESGASIPFTLPHQNDTGVAAMPLSGLTLEGDFSWLGWSHENPFRAFELRLQNPPPGFPQTLVSDIGWNDQEILRAGAAYDLTKRLTARVGYSYATNPVNAAGALLTFPAYGFQVAAIGLTWKICGESNVSIAFDRSFNESVSIAESHVDAF